MNHFRGVFMLVTIGFILNQFAAIVLFLLTFYKWQNTADTTIHNVANIVRHGDNGQESEFPMSSMSSISGSETNDRE
jgi:hypothetical protein